MAVLGVLFGHFVTAGGLNAGRLGVEMFFVLSGRLMADILFVRATPLPTFYARRVSRIFPALLVATAGIFVASRLLPIGWVSLRQLLSCLTMTYNYAQLWIGRAGPLDHLWSLCIEEHVYIVLGGLAWLRRRMRLPIVPTLMTLIVVGWASGLILTLRGGSYYEVYWRSDVRGASILVGALTYLWLRERRPPWLAAPWVPVSCGLAGVALSLNAVPDPVKYSLGTLALGACICLIGRAPPPVLRVLSGRVLPPIGLASFSIYLWQQPFYTAHLHGLRQLAAVVAVLAAGALSYALIEVPSRRWLHRFLRARSDLSAPVEA